MQNFPKIVQVRKIFFEHPHPADTIIKVKAPALPDLMVEIDVIAVV